MNRKEIETMIDLYFDGELEKGREPILFTLLSQDIEGRAYFKKLNALKSGVVDTIKIFPDKLDEKILRSIGKLNERQTTAFINRKVFNAVTYAFTTILLILTIFFYSRSEDYKTQFADLTREVKQQNEKLELLMNALPTVEVTGAYLRTKQIIVKPTM
ncbi:MAG: hypothetical protein COW85_14880 [Ignavibacteria bacterium CG22_combo_CG10-13_8_21_14_all_37_15]|nr:hypothetical protein [Ignavibacteria bacterium]PIP76325.1 MAG: hypothetical protein COW85_14880 [Ignavibacteria bacterium CG22_combo_CG10-13_8_21_14_all_37_15]